MSRNGKKDRNRRIIEEWKDGKRQSDIANEYGITRQRVHAIVTASDRPTHTNRVFDKNIYPGLWKWANDNGFESISEVAAKYGLCLPTLYKIAEGKSVNDKTRARFCELTNTDISIFNRNGDFNEIT